MNNNTPNLKEEVRPTTQDLDIAIKIWKKRAELQKLQSEVAKYRADELESIAKIAYITKHLEEGEESGQPSDEVEKENENENSQPEMVKV